VLVERGYEAVTMDATRERAQVSRALLYNHFQNLDEMLFEVYMREVADLLRALIASSQRAVGFEAKMRATHRAYFDFEESRPVFGLLSKRLFDRWQRPGVPDHVKTMFTDWAATLTEGLELSPHIARHLASAVVGVTEMLANAWREHLMSRAEAEAMALAYSLAGLRAAAEAAVDTESAYGSSLS
jgi:AcrR family transcriptional regulator